MRKIIAALMLAVSTTPALADITGVWSTAAGCEWRARGNDASYPQNFETIAYLTKDGILGWEWGCDFLSEHMDRDGQFVYIASCSAEGDSWPEIMMASPHNANGWRIINKNSVNLVDILDFPVQCEK